VTDGPLSDDEAALVFRRATELDVELASRVEGWEVQQLEDVGREVGISAEAVRRAVAEVRLAPAAPVELTGPVVRATRIVACPPEAAQAALSSWLHEQLLEPVRDRPGVAVFDRRRDPDAVRRRQRDHTRRYRLHRVGRVTLAVAGVPTGRAAVRVEAALGLTRGRRALVRAAAAAPAALVGAALVAAGSGAVGMEHVSLVTPPLVGAAAWWSWRGAGRAQDAEAAEVALALDGALDRLET
jgi:hypothetical protein